MPKRNQSIQQNPGSHEFKYPVISFDVKYTPPFFQSSSGKHPKIRVCTTNSKDRILILGLSSHFLNSLSSATINEIPPWERYASASVNTEQRKTSLDPNALSRKWKCFCTLVFIQTLEGGGYILFFLHLLFRGLGRRRLVGLGEACTVSLNDLIMIPQGGMDRLPYFSHLL